jgi:hypothetical protein
VILFQHGQRREPLGTGEVMPDIQVEPDVLTIRKDGAGLIKSTSRETFLNFFERSDSLTAPHLRKAEVRRIRLNLKTLSPIQLLTFP